MSPDIRQFHDDLVNIIQNTKRNFVQMGQLLSVLKIGESYKEVAGVDTWRDYLAQPEIALTQREGNRLIDIYNTFCLKLEFTVEELGDVPVKSIHYLLPVARDKTREEVEPMLDDAKVLSQKDFRERIYDYKTEDEGERTYQYLIMRKCIETGNMSKIHGVESDEIKNTFNINSDGYVED